MPMLISSLLVNRQVSFAIDQFGSCTPQTSLEVYALTFEKELVDLQKNLHI